MILCIKEIFNNFHNRGATKHALVNVKNQIEHNYI